MVACLALVCQEIDQSQSWPRSGSTWLSRPLRRARAPVHPGASCRRRPPEAGDAVVAGAAHRSPPHKLSILAAGTSLGRCLTIAPTTAWFVPTRPVGRDGRASGGWAAERVVFSSNASGVAHDAEWVTRLARRMVCEFAMSERLAPSTTGTVRPMPPFRRRWPRPLPRCGAWWTRGERASGLLRQDRAHLDAAAQGPVGARDAECRQVSSSSSSAGTRRGYAAKSR